MKTAGGTFPQGALFPLSRGGTEMDCQPQITMKSPIQNLPVRSTPTDSATTPSLNEAGRTEAAARTASTLQKTVKASFNQSAGISGTVQGYSRKSLGERLSVARPAARRKNNTAEKDRHAPDEFIQEDAEDSILIAPTRAIPRTAHRENWSENDQEEDEETQAQRAKVQAHLDEKGLGPLKRYVLLQRALVDLDKKEMTEKARRTRQRLYRKMMTEVYEKDPHELRRALQSPDDESDGNNASNVMTVQNISSVRDLRFLYGASKERKADTPLSPLTMLKAMKKHFGVDYVSPALGELRSRMMSGLRRTR
jgi:hypothetical protein